MAAKQAIQFKLDFNFFAGFEVSELGTFQTGVCSENIHADAIADQDADYRIRHRLLKGSADANDNGLSGPERVAGFASGVEYADVHHAAGAVSMAKTGLTRYRAVCDGLLQQAGAAFLRGALAIQHKANVPVDRVLRGALHDDSSIQHKGGTIRQALNQTEVVRYQEHRDVLPAKLFEFLHASAGENRVADGQGFVDNQDLGIDMNGGGKRQANVHSARSTL